MNSKTILAALLSLTVLLFPPTGHTSPKNIEECLEGSTVTLFRTGQGTATAVVKECLKCPARKLKVTRKTRFIRDGQVIKFTDNLSLQGKAVDVFYDVEKETVRRFRIHK